MPLSRWVARLAVLGAALPLLGADAGGSLTVVLAPQAREAAAPRWVTATREGRSLKAAVTRQDGRLVTRIQVGSPGPWSVSCAGDGVWCPSVVVTAGGGDVTATLPFWPTFTLGCRLSGPSAASRPSRCTLQARILPRKAGQAAFVLERTVKLDEQGGLRTALPRARLDLRIAAEHACPLYFWGLTPPKGELLTLPEQSLRPGSSVAGFVIDDASGAPVPGASVELALTGSGGGSLAEIQRAQLRGARARTDTRGFFQLSGVAPGAYRLTVACGDHPPLSQTVLLEAEEELMLGELRLPPWAELEVRITPSTPGSGERWRVAATPDRGPGASGEASEDGVALLGHLVPGRYFVSVAFPDGQRATVRRIDVEGSSSIGVDLPLVRLSGTLLRGGEPSAGRVTLRFGATSRRFDAGEEGHFEGLFPDPGAMDLMATVEAGGCTAGVGPIRPKRRDDGLELEVSMEDLQLSGHVLDTTGLSVAGAAVSWMQPRLGGQQHTTTGDDGRFQIRCLQPGEVWVEATDGGDRSSGLARVSVAPDADPPEVELTLRTKKALEGMVTRAGVPVPGARVTLNSPVSLFYPSAMTGADGSFRIETVAVPDLPAFTVEIPNALLWAGRAARSGEEGNLQIALPDQAPGTLVITDLDSRGSSDSAKRGRLVLLTGDGGYLTLSELLSWSRSSETWNAMSEGTLPEELVVPGLAPGPVTLAWVEGDPLGGGVLHGASSGTIPPGGRLELSLP